MTTIDDGKTIKLNLTLSGYKITSNGDKSIYTITVGEPKMDVNQAANDDDSAEGNTGDASAEGAADGKTTSNATLVNGVAENKGDDDDASADGKTTSNATLVNSVAENKGDDESQNMPGGARRRRTRRNRKQRRARRSRKNM